MIGIMQGRLSKPRSSLIQEFPWESWREEFPAAHKIGISIIEWTVDHSRILENPLFLDNMIVEIKNLSDLYGIKISSVTLDNFVTAPLHKINPITKKISQVETLFWIIDESIKRNIEILVLPIVAENGGEDIVSLTELKKQMALAQNYLKNKDLKIALECELKIEEIKYLCDSLENFDSIGFNFDIGNSSALNNNTAEEIKLYGDKLFNVHIKDKILNGSTVPLGTGCVNFEKVFKELQLAGYSGNFILQAARIPKQNELITVKKYLDYCNKIKNSF
jgi:L-ribulose-5-phosphate 3-epimerase